jgi:hypothetical protein
MRRLRGRRELISRRIYLRYAVNQMSGTNPRSAHGFPQSLGCVELPYSSAETAFHHLAIGDLVTIAP